MRITEKSLPFWTRLSVGIVASSLVVIAGACSTESAGVTAGSGDGSIPESAQECVDKAKEFFAARGHLPDSLPEELTQLSVGPTPGLTVTRLFPGSTPLSAALSDEVVKTAEQIGWDGRALAYDGSVEDVNRKALEAISYSDVVIIDGLPTAALQQPIKAAADNDVLLVLPSITDPPESVPGYGASPLGGNFFSAFGELAAYAFMEATNCQGKAAAFGVPYDGQHATSDMMIAILEKECPDCSYSYTDIPESDIGSPAATNRVVSMFQTDPNLDFAFFHLGDLAVGVESAFLQAGIRAQIGGALPVSANLRSLEKGTNDFWLGLPPAMTSWIYIDTALRALESGEQTIGTSYPVPVYTSENIESVDPMPVYPKDYVEQFKQLWSVD